MSNEHRYQAELCWTAGPEGGTRSYRSFHRHHLARIDGKEEIRLSADPTFRGDADILNPEDCLLLALSSCHLLTYLSLAARNGVEVLSYRDAAEGTMVLEGSGGHFTEVVLRPTAAITAASDPQLAMRLHHQAGKDCMIASSMNFPVRHEPVIEVQGNPG